MPSHETSQILQTPWLKHHNKATSGISGVNWTVSSLLPGTNLQAANGVNMVTIRTNHDRCNALTISIFGNKIAVNIGFFKPTHFMKPLFESVPCLFYHLAAADLKTHPGSNTKTIMASISRLDMASAVPPWWLHTPFLPVWILVWIRPWCSKMGCSCEMGMDWHQNDPTQIKERLSYDPSREIRSCAFKMCEMMRNVY